MDLSLYLLVSEPDPRLSRVVSLTDTARLPLPVFTYGDRLVVSIYLVTAAGGYHADSTDSGLARTLTLGVRGQSAVAQSSTFTAIANGFQCTLDLDSTQLALFLRAARAGQLALVHKTTGTGPAPTTRCSLDCAVLGDVAVVDDGTTLSEESYYTAAEADALFQPRADGYGSDTNSSGTTTITPGATKAMHTHVLTVSGSAGTRSIVLATTGRVAGDRIRVLADLPATALVVLNFYSGDTGGAVIATRTTDDSGDDLAAEFVYTGTAWRKAFVAYPA